MTIPVRLAAVNLVLNLVLGLVLMRSLGAVGLALANTISSMVHCLALQFFLPGPSIRGFKPMTAFKLAAALMGLFLAAYYGSHFIGMLETGPKIRDLLAVVVVIPLATGIYFGILHLLRYPFLHLLRKKA